MSNKDYYALWLDIKRELNSVFNDDQRIQDFAINYIGVKPQATAVEIVAKVYAKYCELYNQLCECYDQMEQVQRRDYIKTIIDAITCRIIELKKILEEIEVFEYTYSDNALQQMLITPQNVEVFCPFFYPFEIRQAEMQHIMDEIFAGNRLGDLGPSHSEIERREEEKLREEEELKAEKEAAQKKLLALGFEVESTISSEVLSPQEIEDRKRKEEYDLQVLTIQRMERSRKIIKAKLRKELKDDNLYLELSGKKKPNYSIEIRNKAANLIQKIYRRFFEVKRTHLREKKLREKLGMEMSSIPKVSAKVRLEEIKEVRRNFRRKYHEQWVEKNLTENARVLRLREEDVYDDITDELRAWFREWFNNALTFDEFPYEGEGGSILIVRGETFSIEEYMEWHKHEEKRLKNEKSSPKTKEQIKADKIAAKADAKKNAAIAKANEKKRIMDYKKQRLNPDNDPGVFFNVGKAVGPAMESWANYEAQWKFIDRPDAPVEAYKGYLMQIITEDAYQNMHLKVRPIVDNVMRVELELLKRAMRKDYASAQMELPLTRKRQKPKKKKMPKKDKISPEAMFQALADEGVVTKYPNITLDDFWGDRNFACADLRGIQWEPVFTMPCIGDIKELIRIRCLLALGAQCSELQRTQLIVGPRASGKKSLIYAVATEANALLIDLSPFTIHDKFLGNRGTKTMFTYINKISRLMQPTIIYVGNAEKLFYAKVPKEEKHFNPTRLSQEFYREIVKPLTGQDRILVLGTATEPWVAKSAHMVKVFPSVILIPRTDYGSIAFILNNLLMKIHGIKRNFDLHSLAQVLRGYNISSIIDSVNNYVQNKRLAELSYKPLQPMEILDLVMDNKLADYKDEYDDNIYREWYMRYTPWGEKYAYYKSMLASQLDIKQKADKKKPKAK